MNTGIEWQKSSFSGGGGEQCLEVAQHADQIMMRESDDPWAVTTISRARFAAFIRGVKAGTFDHFTQ
ncbi:DUF397 domain-containing protein [Streptomyces sp. SID11233]|uniref:DUF397 domain-containing protein n=1 Tax=unclassified Streptomyces TaxID=2593676 RepID=UPI0013C0EEB4|nr:DUF397 domain-containing protein [Streptomyces sp. SID11233]